MTEKIKVAFYSVLTEKCSFRRLPIDLEIFGRLICGKTLVKKELKNGRLVVWMREDLQERCPIVQQFPDAWIYGELLRGNLIFASTNKCKLKVITYLCNERKTLNCITINNI